MTCWRSSPWSRSATSLSARAAGIRSTAGRSSCPAAKSSAYVAQGPVADLGSPACATHDLHRPRCLARCSSRWRACFTIARATPSWTNVRVFHSFALPACMHVTADRWCAWRSHTGTSAVSMDIEHIMYTHARKLGICTSFPARPPRSPPLSRPPQSPPRSPPQSPPCAC